MVTPAGAVQAVLAACTRCSQIWLLSLDRQTCIVCGGPPSATMPFADAGAAPSSVEPPSDDIGAAPADYVDIPSRCPHCGGDVVVRSSASSLEVLPPPSMGPAEEDATQPIEGADVASSQPAVEPASPSVNGDGEPEPPEPQPDPQPATTAEPAS